MSEREHEKRSNQRDGVVYIETRLPNHACSVSMSDESVFDFEQ